MIMIIDIVVLIFIYLIISRKWKENFVLNTLMYIYISFVLYFTMMPIVKNIPIMINRIIYHFGTNMNMNLFDDLFNQRGDYLRQIFLNVLMMIPFGFMYPINGRSFFKTIFMTFIFSLTIELLQPFVSSRTSDITDLLTNTLGGIIGYIFYLIFKPLINKIFVKRSNV